MEWDNGLAELIEGYFQNMFAAEQTESEAIINCVRQTITNEQNVELLKPITPEEVKHAVFQMHPDKAPEPDGMTPAFFQKHWSIVGDDVVKMVSKFFQDGVIPGALNDTNIVLIPKKKNPVELGELRPISLCNVLMKVVTKVLANRLKGMLDVVVSDTQSAFIPGRLISDNIMVAYEVMHYLKRKKVGKDGYMALKLDMSKAYDRMEWEFLKAILRKMGFSQWWVHLVLQCVSTVSYNIVHGEHNMGPINPSRGIRQGDPLSPYLFIICAEGLSSVIKEFESKKWIKGVSICRRAPVISHMLFADDSYLFCKADVGEAEKVLELLHLYEKASGQKVNMGKSSVFFSTNVITYNRNDICQRLQMLEADDQTKYLGLPNILGRNKSAILGFLKDKVNAKVRSWDNKTVSKSGKEILIRSVAQSLPAFAMNVFLLPLEVCKDVERSLTQYWWGSSQERGRKIHWLSWDRLSKHKSTGGLGFRSFRDFNIAMLGKQAWRFLTKPDSLVTRVYKARYFANGNFLEAGLGSNPSFIWRSVLVAKDLVKQGIRWVIGPGEGVNIKGQPWLADVNDPYISTDSEAVEGRKVVSLMCVDRREWEVDIIRDIFNGRDQEAILNTRINVNNTVDTMYWRLESSGIYSVRSAYKFLQMQKERWAINDSNNIWSKLWKIRAPAKTLNLLWRALSCCLPTNVQLQQKHVQVQLMCPVCSNGDESAYHSLVLCDFASQCWRRIFTNFQPDGASSFPEWFVQTVDACNVVKRAEVAVVCWAIWKARNELVWNQKRSQAWKVVESAKEYLKQWSTAQNRSYVASVSPMRDGDGASKWVKPQIDTIKVTVDAAIFKNRGEFGFGLVARDCRGDLVLAKSVLHKGVASPELAEAMAVKEALSWIKSNGWFRVVLESDSLVTVQAIRSSEHMCSPFGLVVEECRQLLRLSNNIYLYFIRRSANVAAHSLARASYLYPGRSFDRNSGPVELKNSMLTDYLN